MTSIYIALLSVTAVMSEVEVIDTFAKEKQVHEKFLSDTRQYREETEKFHETMFIPAVDNMVSLLDKGKCKKCLVNYLQALTYKTSNADEMITEQLSKIISYYANQLNNACKQTSKENLEKISPFFLDAFDLVESQKIRTKNQDKKSKDIASCLPIKIEK